MTFKLTEVLQNWYIKHARELPWRETKEPYRIWLSEVILQQTRVEQGLPYYTRFCRQYPTLTELANADEQEVLSLWQGLGYYSRGRNLLKCAQIVENEHHGVFPRDINALLKLPGIGTYTAAAIASFCYDQPHAVLDGNVYRVLARFFGINTPINTPKAQREFRDLADAVIDRRNPARHNQSIMEFGALQCTPKNPNCKQCPLQDTCIAYSTNAVSELPQKLKSKPKKHRYFHYFVSDDKSKIWLEKRLGNDIWKNLYQFPLIETTSEIPTDFSTHRKIFKTGNPEHFRKVYSTTHLLSHQRILCTFWEVPKSLIEIPEKSDIFEVQLNEIDSWPMPVVLANFIQSQIA